MKMITERIGAIEAVTVMLMLRVQYNENDYRERIGAIEAVTVMLILRVQYNENDYRENWSNRSSDSDADAESSIQ